mmetsp:Transcript_12126/g.32511  ORF Transcript_12126/g.32511 Transcript_12126/m.32511 type:complete len:555 (-) Transcript_12126:43-1707(-)
MVYPLAQPVWRRMRQAWLFCLVVDLCSVSQPGCRAYAGSSPDGRARNESDANVTCDSLVPQSSARKNYFTILGCLNSGDRRAVLAEGTFQLHRGIAMPDNSSLVGVAVDANGTRRYPRLRIAVPTAMTSFVVRIGNASSLSSLTLDGAENLRGFEQDCCASILSVMGSGSVVEDIEAFNFSVGAGVYIHGAASSGNVLTRVHIHSCYYGLIFEHGLKQVPGNVFSDGVIEHIACDAVTFGGYGELHASVVRDSGYECGRNVPRHPGGGIYCSGNAVGGVVRDNRVHGMCGQGLDMDSCANFNISANMFHTRVEAVYPEHGHCYAFATVSLLDTRDTLFQDNIVVNERGVVLNEQGPTLIRASPEFDPNQMFTDVDWSAVPFADLPGGSRTAIGLAVLRRPRHGAQPAIDNVVARNHFRASCRDRADAEEPCVGVGYFVSRGTGSDENADYHLQNRWSPTKFTANLVEGSDIGSKRCGRNWYAAEEPICRRGSESPCNEDDYEHPEGNYRNDDCWEYTALVGEPMKLDGIGRLRIPLPLPLPAIPKWHPPPATAS